MSNGILYISRHGESEWNTLGRWTGWTDVSLTEKGVNDAKAVGRAFLQGISFDAVYTSDLKRTHETLDALMEGAESAVRSSDDGIIHASELKERDYGIYTGKDKWEVQKEVAEDVFTCIRRGWDYPIPEGENLKQVYDRTVPYFLKEILPRLKRGEKVLIVAHGNSIRALMKYLDDVTDEGIADVEMPLGHLLIYTFDGNSDMPLEKQDLSINIGSSKA